MSTRQTSMVGRLGLALSVSAAVLVVWAVMPPAARSQSYAWSRQYSTVSEDMARGVAMDASGNIVLTGSFASNIDFGGGPLPNAGLGSNVDIFLAKFDATGNHVWSRSFGSSLGDIGHAVGVDVSGNVLVTGLFYQSVDFGGGPLASNGANDIFLAKYTAGGAHVWSRRFGSTGNDTGYAVAADDSGNVFVTGHFTGTVDFGGGGLTSPGGTDIFVAKYDASGAHVWSKRFGSATGFGEAGYGLAVDGSGGVCITGQFASTVDFGGGPLSSGGSLDAFLAKYDRNGVHQWSKRFGDIAGEQGRAVAFDGSGNLVCVGYFGGTSNFGGGALTSAGFADVFVAKYDPNGVHLWSHGFGSTGSDVAYGVAADAAGVVAVTGAFDQTVNFGGGPLTNAGGINDIFAAVFDANGEHQWSQRFGGGAAGGDIGNGVALSGTHGLVLTGYFTGTADFGSGPFVGQGADIFLVKFATSLASVDWPAGPHGIALAARPNPASPGTTIHYSLPASGRVRVEIFDARGRRVASLVNRHQSAGSHAVRWEGRSDSGPPVGPGVYFLKVEQQGSQRTSKLAVVR